MNEWANKLSRATLPNPPWHSVPQILTQVKAYIWNNISRPHLELVTQTSAPDSLLSFQFLPLIMSSGLFLTRYLLSPWTNGGPIYIKEVFLLDPMTFPRVP